MDQVVNPLVDAVVSQAISTAVAIVTDKAVSTYKTRTKRRADYHSKDLPRGKRQRVAYMNRPPTYQRRIQTLVKGRTRYAKYRRSPARRITTKGYRPRWSSWRTRRIY